MKKMTQMNWRTEKKKNSNLWVIVNNIRNREILKIERVG